VWLLVYERWAAPDVPAPDPLGSVVSAAGAETDVTSTSFFGGWNSAWSFHVAWVLLGVLLLALVRSAALRDWAASAGRVGYRALRAVVWDTPKRVWTNPAVRAFLTSWPFQMAVNYLVKPAVLSVLVWTAFRDLWQAGLSVRLLTFLAAAFLINSRIGQAAESLLLQVATAVVQLVRSGLFPGLFRWVADVFRQFTDVLEWGLARGEDWLRLRGRGGPVAVIVRIVGGLVWFPLAFLTRFYLVVLIEPMLNPLKLPLSILFAKFVYPMLALLGLFTLQPLSSPLVEDLAPILTSPVAWVLVIGTFYLLPDAVTFLFWEMRENWRLYRANRPVAVRPAAVGPHGESVGGLLRLGFHSGTVPRLYARLRAAERRAAHDGLWRDARTYRQALHVVEQAVRRFVTREFVAVLNAAPAWGERKLSVGRVQLGTNRIRVELCLEGVEAPAALEWEDRSGWLVAGWAEPGWVPELSPTAARLFENALTYLYRRAGVWLVREHVRANLPPGAVHTDVTRAGLLVWCGSREAAPVLYDLTRRSDELRPRTPDNLYPAAGPVLDAHRLVFARVRLTWPQWLAAWPSDLGACPPPRFGPPDFDLVLLPRGGEAVTPLPAAFTRDEEPSRIEVA
jgi:hypothetical protein